MSPSWIAPARDPIYVTLLRSAVLEVVPARHAPAMRVMIPDRWGRPTGCRSSLRRKFVDARPSHRASRRKGAGRQSPSMYASVTEGGGCHRVSASASSISRSCSRSLTARSFAASVWATWHSKVPDGVILGLHTERGRPACRWHRFLRQLPRTGESEPETPLERSPVDHEVLIHTTVSICLLAVTWRM